jgi:hypothetical protein
MACAAELHQYLEPDSPKHVQFNCARLGQPIERVLDRQWTSARSGKKMMAKSALIYLKTGSVRQRIEKH